MLSRVKIFIFAVVFSQLLSAGCSPNTPTSGPIDYSTINSANDFTLKDQDGREFHLRDLRGKVVLLFFGYLSCPDICPTTLSKVSKVYSLLGDKRADVVTLFVSVDPERDSPAKIKEYLNYFNLNAVGLTGTKAEIDAVVAAYKATYEKVETHSALGYLINHSDYVYVINRSGQVVDLMHYEDKPEKISQAVKKL